MANITVGQIIMEVQRMASRVKDLDTISSSLLVEAEGNNRLVESLRQFQDDMDSLNRISNNKSNAEMVNRIQQQNANSSELLKENRELKICIEDYERAMELIMQKYREHTGAKILDSKMNFRDLHNEKLWSIIREQREKINEMAAVMQRAAAVGDDDICRDLETMTRLRLENKALRELLQISKQFGSAARPIRLNDHLLEEKAVQTDADDSADELSLSGASIENANNNSVIQMNVNSAAAAAAASVTNTAANHQPTDNAATAVAGGDNNNGPTPPAAPSPPPPSLALSSTLLSSSSTSSSSSSSSSSSTSLPSNLNTANATAKTPAQMNADSHKTNCAELAPPSVVAATTSPLITPTTAAAVSVANANAVKPVVVGKEPASAT